MLKVTFEIKFFNPSKTKKRPSKQSLIQNTVVLIGLATAIINLIKALI